MNAAALLRSARREAGLTQRRVAAAAGVTQPVVAAYEAGRRQPTLPMLEKLLRACGRELDVQTRPVRRLPDPERAAHRLAMVLDLAERLPHRRRGALTFPARPLAPT